MKNSSIFFANEQNSLILKKFKKKIDTIYTEEQFEISRNSHIKTIIHSMANSPEQWDKLCEININWIGDHFLSLISSGKDQLTKEILDNVYSICFRFLFELYLSMKNDLSIEFERARKFAFENMNLFESNAKEQIEYTIRDMPINIFSNQFTTTKTLTASKILTKYLLPQRQKKKSGTRILMTVKNE